MTDETPTVQPMTTAKVSDILFDLEQDFAADAAEAYEHQEYARGIMLAKVRDALASAQSEIATIEQRAANAERESAALRKLERFDRVAITRSDLNTEPGMEWYIQTGPLGPTAWGGPLLLAAIESLPAPAGDDAGVKDE